MRKHRIRQTRCHHISADNNIFDTLRAKFLIPSVHPGEVLLEEFLKSMGLSQNKPVLNIGVPARRINEIVLEKRRITAETLGERLEKEVRIYSKVA